MSDTAIDRLGEWIKQNGYAGYDPYDVKGTRVGLLCQRHWLSKRLFDAVVSRHPQLSRKLLRVKPSVNPKGMALMARGYLQLSERDSSTAHAESARECLSWLESNSSDRYDTYCWGYPFDWQSRYFIPSGTPSSVVTGTVIHAFLDAYEYHGTDPYLDVATRACAFLRDNLNRTEYDDGTICFSYTPSDEMYVHNANLFTASALLRTAKHVSRSEFVHDGKRAMEFTARHQRDDGSWYYWAPPSEIKEVIDNYHTGFVLEHINECRRALGEKFAYEQTLQNGLEYYSNNLFIGGGIPKYSVDSMYPIDIHACAQGIITFCELSDFIPECRYRSTQICEWTTKHMQDSDGHFYYRHYQNRINKMPYLRWGQAWMLRALSYGPTQSQTRS